MTLPYANIPGGLELQNNLRLHSLRLRNDRLTGTSANRTLQEINSDRGFAMKGGMHAIGGSGLPEPDAYEEARMIGNIVGGSRMIGGMKRMTKAEMKTRSKELGHLYGSELAKTDPELKGMKGGGASCMNEFKKAFMASLSASKDDKDFEDVDVEVLPKARKSRGKGVSGGGVSGGGVSGGAMSGGLRKYQTYKPVKLRDNSHFHNPYLESEGKGMSGGSYVVEGAITGGGVSGGAMSGGKKKRVASSKMKQRGAMVSKLMKEKGMTLGQASSYISKHNLI